MKNDLTYIAMLLDRSGSMDGSIDDVVGGVNKFLRDQQKIPGEALVTIAKFDDVYETVYEDVAIKDARPITVEDIAPRGGTALADATMRLINHIGAKLSLMHESERPSQVIIQIFSDGGENKSRETSMPLVAEKVKHQETHYNWKFMFIGMEIDTQRIGGALGLSGGMLGAKKGSRGIGQMLHAASAYVGSSRMGHTAQADAIYTSLSVDDKAATHATEAFDAQLAEVENAGSSSSK